MWIWKEKTKHLIFKNGGSGLNLTANPQILRLSHFLPTFVHLNVFPLNFETWFKIKTQVCYSLVLKFPEKDLKFLKRYLTHYPSSVLKDSDTYYK